MKLVKNELSSLDRNIYHYLLENAIGKKNAIPADKLCYLFNINERELRYSITNLRLSDQINRSIGSCNLGYFIPELNEDGNAMLRNRALASMKIYLKNSGQGAIKVLYDFLNQYKDYDENKPQKNQEEIKF